LAARKLFSGPDDPRIQRALCVVAHPDDIDFFCAGTVLLMTRRGVVVDFVLATSGDKGSRDGAASGVELAATREQEQVASAGVLGAGRVEFLRRRDAELVDSLELRREVVREIRRSRPDVLLSFDPTPGYRQHPDHRVIGRVALDAAWPCARDPLTYPEMGPPHETAEAWLFGGPAGARVDLEVGVSEVLDRKIAARLEHHSQTGDPAELRQRWRRVASQERFAQIDLR
jgi:LmbE family N-acetylglucosaminyl deacetylase